MNPSNTGQKRARVDECGANSSRAVKKVEMVDKVYSQHLECPICLSIMTNPFVLIQTGIAYDKECIKQWFANGHTTCPVTQNRITDKTMAPVYPLRQLCAIYLVSFRKYFILFDSRS